MQFLVLGKNTTLSNENEYNHKPDPAKKSDKIGGVFTNENARYKHIIVNKPELAMVDFTNLKTFIITKYTFQSDGID